MTDSAALPNDENVQNPEVQDYSFADYFYAALFEPVETIKKLSAEYPVHAKDLWFNAFILVFLAGAIAGCVSAQKPADVVYRITLGILDLMFNWYIASYAMSGLSNMMGKRKYTFKESASITGLAFAPLVLIGLLGCLAALPKVVYALAMTVPIYWSFFIFATAYRISLGLTYVRLGLLIMIVPPLLFLVYAFWFGSAILMLLGTLLRAS